MFTAVIRETIDWTMVRGLLCVSLLMVACADSSGREPSTTWGIPPPEGGTTQGGEPGSDTNGPVASTSDADSTTTSDDGAPDSSTGLPPADTGSDSGSAQPPLDLDAVIWLHDDVSDWPETVVLSEVTFDGGQICLEHDVADQQPPWPTNFINEVEVIANPWVFIYHDDQWYGATWEWLRPPGQTCKNMTSVAGDHIKKAPFDEASGWVPTSGQTYYFMVSGLARLGVTNVQERSNIVEVVWP